MYRLIGLIDPYTKIILLKCWCLLEENISILMEM